MARILGAWNKSLFITTEIASKSAVNRSLHKCIYFYVRRSSISTTITRSLVFSVGSIQKLLYFKVIYEERKLWPWSWVCVYCKLKPYLNPPLAYSLHTYHYIFPREANKTYNCTQRNKTIIIKAIYTRSQPECWQLAPSPTCLHFPTVSLYCTATPDVSQ